MDNTEHVVERVSTKLNDPCLKKAADDEPIFTLRAQDVTAPIVIMFWILMVLIFNATTWMVWEQGSFHQNDTSDNTLRSAFEQALRMRHWRNHKIPD